MFYTCAEESETVVQSSQKSALARPFKKQTFKSCALWMNSVTLYLNDKIFQDPLKSLLKKTAVILDYEDAFASSLC